ncbi:EamA family transporter RarD [Ornithinicoccus halotolerans]|uniref:EamA family transporter RarD n=1 Tax=Ornithinicoccus halotolerans TaxID=1748220 RepID=UPI0012976E66|nr:EamA family transporter RarD [Ornithinicoccus halotolerans]
MSAAGGSARGAPEYPDRARGAAFGLSAYGLWGLFPLFFALLRPAGPVEILAHRIVWTLLICLVALAVMGQLRWVRQLLRRPRLAAGVATAGALIACNWTIYTFAVLTGHVTEAALGYFLNPLVTVALGVVLLREGLRTLQWVAVGVGLVAAVYLTIDYGTPPWISFSLALSFASYGLLKNRVGSSLSALQSLSGETLFVLPAALAVLLVLGVTGTGTFVTEGPGHLLLLMACGPATTIPLLFFAAAARRVPLVSIGLMQFLTPVLQLLCGVLILGEVMPLSRWVGFALVWLALTVLTLDSLRAAGRARRLGRAAQAATA